MMLMALFCSSSPDSRAASSDWAVSPLQLHQLTPAGGAPSSGGILAASTVVAVISRCSFTNSCLSTPLPPHVLRRGARIRRAPSFQHNKTKTTRPSSLSFCSWNNDTCREQQQPEVERRLPRETSWMLGCSMVDSKHILAVCWCCCLLILLLCLGNLKRVPPSTARRLQNYDFSVLVLLLQKMSLLAFVLLTMVGEADWWWSASATVTWQSLVSTYMSCLDTHPIITKSVTAGVIAMIGDYCAQWMELALEESLFIISSRTAPNTAKRIPKYTSAATLLSIYGRYKLRRGFSLLADGIFISGPLMHVGYEIFERLVPITAEDNDDDAASATLAAILHVVADTVVLDSFFVAFTFLSTGLMEGMHPRELWTQFRADYSSSLTVSWATSVALCPIQFCFFRYLPLQLRVLSVNCIDLVWGAVQSFMSHRNRHHG